MGPQQTAGGRAAADLVLLCASAGLTPLVEGVRREECDLRLRCRRLPPPHFGGFGIVRWAIRRLCGAETEALISGQRAMRVEVLRARLATERVGPR